MSAIRAPDSPGLLRSNRIFRPDDFNLHFCGWFRYYDIPAHGHTSNGSRYACRVQRKDFTLYIYDLELRKVLITHDVTWSRKDSFCKGQFTDDQPEEKPSVPVKISITQKKEDPPKSAFAKFAFGGDRNE